MQEDYVGFFGFCRIFRHAPRHRLCGWRRRARACALRRASAQIIHFSQSIWIADFLLAWK
jgi:hypothetical protein